MRKLKTNKGITLIALIITIIVMLLLVGVTISESLNGGLFTTAQRAVSDTQIQLEKEQLFEVAIGSIGEDGKVNFSKLDNNLPDIFEKVGERKYKSNVTGKIYMVNEYGNITILEETEQGLLKLKVEISQTSETTLLISYEIPYEEVLDETEAVKILAQAYSVQGVETLQDLNLAVGIMINSEITTYNELQIWFTEQTKVKNPTDKTIFSGLASMLGYNVDSPQELAIKQELYQPEIKLTINNKDETELINGNQANYLVPEYGEYQISLEMNGIKEEEKIEITRPTTNEDLGLKVELSEINPITLAISSDDIPYITKKLTINGEDKTELINGNQANYVIPEYSEYQISLEVDGIKNELTIETNKQFIVEKLNWDTSKVNIREEENEESINIIPVPKGFEVSTSYKEDEMLEGLVITDGENEFVWVPVANGASYAEDDFGPLTDNVYSPNGYEFDSYQTIEYLYKTALGTINNTDSFNRIFTYEEDKENIEKNIRKYRGFYVGRYETTYDSTDKNGVPQEIGVKRGKNILTSHDILQAETNTTNNEPYYYRWWGLYKAQKNIYAENEIVGSIMISSKQWDEIMAFTDYGNEKRPENTYANLTGADMSASSYKTDSTKYDEANNIFDLAGNVEEWTMTVDYPSSRVCRGGLWVQGTNPASYVQPADPDNPNYYCGSRITLYIK